MFRLKTLKIPRAEIFRTTKFNNTEWDFQAPNELQVGINPYFFMEKDGELIFAVINGFPHRL